MNNNNSQHVSSQFAGDLASLRSQVLQMGGLVESQVAAVIDVYSSCDAENIARIIELDQQVNALEKTIDDDCAHLIAKRQPAASDLRLVFGISKIVTDLERVGDEAKKIAKAVRRIVTAGQQPTQYGTGIKHIAEVALNMIHAAMDAFARMDSAAAEAVIRSDSELDIEFKSIVRQLVTHMMEDPRNITSALDVIWMARAVERIGDHAKNVAEQIVFIVEGRDIRYPEKDKSR